MRRYFPEQGRQSRLAHYMMKQTATVQANFDYLDEADATAKMRTAFGVTSIVTALCAASPISEGRPNGFKSQRAAIWLETDEDRAGILPFAFQPGFSFRDYAEWALDVPMFFVVRDGTYRPARALTFRRFVAEGFEGEEATMRDWEVHLSTVFPEVRLKRYIEVRGADAGPLPMAGAVAALWRGVLDDPEACAAAWTLVAGATLAEREALRRAVPREGLAARFGGRSVRDLAVELLALGARRPRPPPGRRRRRRAPRPARGLRLRRPLARRRPPRRLRGRQGRPDEARREVGARFRRIGRPVVTHVSLARAGAAVVSNLPSFHPVPWPSGKARVCKTLIPRFKSGRHLQIAR